MTWKTYNTYFPAWKCHKSFIIFYKLLQKVVKYLRKNNPSYLFIYWESMWLSNVLHTVYKFIYPSKKSMTKLLSVLQ